MHFRSLFIRQISQQLAQWQEVAQMPKPRHGWIRYIRKALGMTTAQLAHRLKSTRGGIVHFEIDELRGSITLKSLSKIANAMECELIYAIVPKTSLEEILKSQAAKIATKKVNYISHSMALENQQLTEQQDKEQIAELIKLLLEGPAKKLWDE